MTRRRHPILSSATLLRLKRLRAPTRAPARLAPARRTLRMHTHMHIIRT
jgi:hypothetical protein